MTKETGTLAELNVQPGDVVEFEVGNGRKISHTIATSVKGCFVSKETGRALGDAVFWSVKSRASDTPKTWGEMTDAEKGALLLAHHEGKKIEVLAFWRDGNWLETPRPAWGVGYAYRIKPEPKRETVEAYGRVVGADKVWVIGEGKADGDTHCITFDTLDGEPVLDTIRMEKIGEGDQ